MELRCYLCDGEVNQDAKQFKIGSREELICLECYTKTVNRKRALSE